MKERERRSLCDHSQQTSRTAFEDPALAVKGTSNLCQLFNNLRLVNKNTEGAYPNSPRTVLRSPSERDLL